MSGWHVLAWGITCASGGILFLFLVARAIENASNQLEELEGYAMAAQGQ